jgi:exonuclease V gamma subunit
MMNFSPVKEAPAILAHLLEIYWRGLSRALPFFPATAFKYANAELSPSKYSKSSPLEKARRVWNGSKWNDGRPEKNDRYYAFCFPDPDPLNGEFTDLALEVFGPMLRNAALNP